MADPPEPEHEPDIEVVLRSARDLDPADRLRLIARLWASLPLEHWAAPTSDQQTDIMRRLDPATSDSILEVPWRIIDRVLDHYPKASPAKVYSAPRRFDLATIFVVTTAYCLLFASLSALNWPGIVSLIVGGFITLVGIGQAVLYGGTRPRKASIVVGIGLCGIGSATPLLFQTGRVYPDGYLLGMFLYVAIVGTTSGAILGYLAGTLVGGIFLITDYVRQRFSRPPDTQRDELPASIAAAPASPEAS
jgi:hypothetical protein